MKSIEIPAKQRCQVCRELINLTKEQLHEVAFYRNTSKIEKYLVCSSCFNKYLLSVRHDIMPEDYHPEKIREQAFVKPVYIPPSKTHIKKIDTKISKRSKNKKQKKVEKQ